MAIWAADVCSRAARQLILCIEPTGRRLRHIGKTDPQCGTVQFCFHSGRLTCSARTGFRAVTSPLVTPKNLIGFWDLHEYAEEVRGSAVAGRGEGAVGAFAAHWLRHHCECVRARLTASVC